MRRWRPEPMSTLTLPSPREEAWRWSDLDTLRAAAPWQKLRGRDGRMQVRRDDLRIRRFETRAEALTSLLAQWAEQESYEVLAARSGQDALRQVLMHDFAVILAKRDTGQGARFYLLKTAYCLRAHTIRKMTKERDAFRAAQKD